MLTLSSSPISDGVKKLTQFIPCFNNSHSDRSALARLNLITVDLGIARELPCRAVQAASWEHPVLKEEEHQTRQMAHKSWRSVRSVNRRPSSGKFTVSRWATASASKHDTGTGDSHYWLTAVTGMRPWSKKQKGWPSLISLEMETYIF